MVNDYIKHLKNIEFTKQLRATVTKNEAKTRKTKKYEDYNWSAMIKDGSIGKLTIIELNKFLQANKLPQQGNKPDKIKTIVNLGVLLSNDGSFTTHIDSTCAKASRTLGFLSRNLKACPEKLKTLAFNSMCRSTLEYAAPIWDPYQTTDMKKFDKIQRRGARFVTRNQSNLVLANNKQTSGYPIRRKPINFPRFQRTFSRTYPQTHRI